MNISYIIGHRGNVPERIRNLRIVLDWLKSYNFEVIIVEQDDAPKIKELICTYGYKYIFAFNPGLYNRSWGMNIGIRNSKHEVIVCADNDMILESSAMEVCYNLCEEYDVVNPFRGTHDLNEYQTNMIFKEAPRLVGERVGMNICSGIFFTKRQCLFDVGLWDERFRGWGGEDDAMTMKFRLTGKKIIEKQYVCYHLFHSRTKADTNCGQHYENNKKILSSYSSASIEEHIKRIDTCGLLNKYEN
jgi:glycosyltransferase involved in cell wall biosynthesis